MTSLLSMSIYSCTINKLQRVVIAVLRAIKLHVRMLKVNNRILDTVTILPWKKTYWNHR